MPDLDLQDAGDGTYAVVDHDGLGPPGAMLGTVTVSSFDDHTATVSWDLGPTEEPERSTAIAMAVARAFEDFGVTRVQALVSLDAVADRRAAARAGLRRDGVVRHAHRSDEELVSRLSDDPQPGSREGFVAMLNAALPRKRAIAQALVRDESGRVLLCELTYKREWDLPGGVVDPSESPAGAIVRELREELGVTARVRRLVTVNYLPPWSAWDDAVLFVFEVEPFSDDEAMTLQPTEIAAVHWCTADDVREHGTAATIRLLDGLDADPDAPYREAGTPFAGDAG
ncbi:ADP-ribose pyrophosphatase YjhB (NUDIX family) [Mumia flava]|uniref:ADP-ribose pyrophosphatase YjhB (NUDIX family) n=1 Tax=Mumia flava TaxID=1348852 RepID=A0A2M9B8A5_9ACTN|nr:NUDIX hydrolase [Mumia flava]PJJ54172.1 ADP-ribose pyrophosphatase YjhB (NUDIX family) [Mumia flava]